MRKIVKLRKTGNSLAITIPKEMVDELEWTEGNSVFLETKPSKESYFKGPKVLNIEKA
jgi:antitoxin component of MazEF toxin-antitoxin module